MLYIAALTGESPLIQHNAQGVDPRHIWNVEKASLTRKKGSNRTASDDARLAELETALGLYLDDTSKQVVVPAAAIRSCIESAARKLKQGPQVREGLLVTGTSFSYDTERYGSTFEELIKSTQFHQVVVVQRQRLIRVRPKFDLPWSVTCYFDCDDELVDENQLATWLDIAGRRIGIGDWRPEKSGTYGRFSIASLRVSTAAG